MKLFNNQKSSIRYLLNCADTRLLCGLNLLGSPYILHTNFSLHGSSCTANSWNISSNFCTTGVYTGSCVATCCGGLTKAWNNLRRWSHLIIRTKQRTQNTILLIHYKYNIIILYYSRPRGMCVQNNQTFFTRLPPPPKEMGPRSTSSV